MLLVDFILCQHGIGRSRCGSVTLRLGHAPALTVPRTVRAGAPLRYALDSGSTGRKAVQVQVLLPAPNSTNPNPKPIGEGFGFVIFIDYPNFNSKRKN